MAKVSDCFPVVGGLRQSMGPVAGLWGKSGHSGGFSLRRRGQMKTGHFQNTKTMILKTYT
jgi:hypothetical protein